MADFEADLDAKTEINELRKALNRTQGQLRAAKQRDAHLAQALHQAAYDALVAVGQPKSVTPPPKDRRTVGGEVALMHLTDWQGAKVTPSYNTAVMYERVNRFMDKSLTIVDYHRKARPIKNCVIMFGGDMMEGLFNYPAQLWQIDATLFEQWATVSALVVDTVRRALGSFEHVEVVAEWGNHGRIGSKRDHVPKNDNFDRMIYEHSRQLLKAEKRLTWEDCPEDVQKVEIGAYRALLAHGDEIGRNGFASPTTLLRWANNQASGAFGWDFRDVYFGHFHHSAEWSMANGKGTVYQTGSTESDNRYARDSMAATAIPSQRLHFVDPRAGRVTAQYKIEVAE